MYFYLAIHQCQSLFFILLFSLSMPKFFFIVLFDSWYFLPVHTYQKAYKDYCLKKCALWVSPIPRIYTQVNRGFLIILMLCDQSKMFLTFSVHLHDCSACTKSFVMMGMVLVHNKVCCWNLSKNCCASHLLFNCRCFSSYVYKMEHFSNKSRTWHLCLTLWCVQNYKQMFYKNFPLL